MTVARCFVARACGRRVYSAKAALSRPRFASCLIPCCPFEQSFFLDAFSWCLSACINAGLRSEKLFLVEEKGHGRNCRGQAVCAQRCRCYSADFGQAVCSRLPVSRGISCVKTSRARSKKFRGTSDCVVCVFRHIFVKGHCVVPTKRCVVCV